jgi:SAM-dependent methyltransferase
MKNKIFGQVYADQYDLLYTDKDYEAECDLIEEVFRKYGNGEVKTILDLGCGTGNHAIPLASRGYEVTGVDISPDMLHLATEKVHAFPQPQSYSQSQPTFLLGDVRSIDLQQQFDAVLMMFAVLGYQMTNEDVFAALHTVSRHLKPGGLFICDVWYVPAVLIQRPTERVKIIPTPKGKIIRTASGQLDTYRHLCEVRYHIFCIED